MIADAIAALLYTALYGEYEKYFGRHAITIMYATMKCKTCYTDVGVLHGPMGLAFEGMNHIIRRMFHSIQNEVKRLVSS